jgi:hypothetical protein
MVESTILETLRFWLGGTGYSRLKPWAMRSMCLPDPEEIDNRTEEFGSAIPEGIKAATPIRDHMDNRHNLGSEGERLAFSMLARAGFTDIEPLRTNYQWADFRARRSTDPVTGLPSRLFAWEGRRTGTTLHLISVKARNKWEKGSSLNSRYLLGNDCLRKMREALAEHHNEIIPSFLVFAVEPETLDCYFGYIEKLRIAGRNCKGVPMSRAAPGRYGYQVLAVNERHGLNYSAITNLLDSFGSPVEIDNQPQHSQAQEDSRAQQHCPPHTRVSSTGPDERSCDVQKQPTPSKATLTPLEKIAYDVLLAVAPKARTMAQLKTLMREHDCMARSYYEVFNGLVCKGLAIVTTIGRAKSYRLWETDQDDT